MGEKRASALTPSDSALQPGATSLALGTSPLKPDTLVAPMDLSEVRSKLEAAEERLAARDVAVFADFRTSHGDLRVSVTDRLRRKCRKGRVWKSPTLLTALKNGAYGFDPKASRSRGGADGIFSVDRNFKPANAMMAKLFAQFLDKPDPLVDVLAAYLGTPAKEWFTVRLVSHHLRLLGVLVISASGGHLVLVDYDDEKSG